MRSTFTAPPARSHEQLRNHYEVERELAARLRTSTREERMALFGQLYEELFRRVPDHPRWTRLESEELKHRNIAAQMRLLREHLYSDTTLVEFAPGNCWLSVEAAKSVAQVIAVDISNQGDPQQVAPPNFRHIAYDGYHLDLPDGCASVAYSYQFLEHLHPDDVSPHFQLVQRLLKPGGLYVFDTPHRFSGPHDISREFSDTLDCFHFQEWTYSDMRHLLALHGFPKSWIIRFGKMQQNALLNMAVDLLEKLFTPFPHKLRRKFLGRLFSSVAMVAQRA